MTGGPASSIGSLRRCARRHLAEYTDPKGERAFATYDRLGDPDRLSPLDCLGPVLLSVRLTNRQVIPLFQPTGQGADLLAAMQAVLDHPNSGTTDFLTVDRTLPGTAWAAVEEALTAARAHARVKWVKEVAITKILHRKRPNLVPIFDGRVYSFYRGHLPRQGPAAARELFDDLQPDLAANRGWLADLARSVRTPDDRPLSVLRAADIILWEHQTGAAYGRPCA
jgi:hypothetical protein